MSFKIAGGAREAGIVIGNTYDKYGSANPVVKFLMKGFEAALSDFLVKADPRSIHEIGCGEGYWVLRWSESGLLAKGCDVSKQVIEVARANAVRRALAPSLFQSRSIYDLDPKLDSADLVVCCEVLEHLNDPEAGLRALQRIVGRHLIISVPREPLWCALNLARGRYVASWGSTPGHVQHWSKGAFVALVSRHFEIAEVKTPLPWTMLLCVPRGNV
jgi:SAM-dependent methyltransferase